MAANEERAGAGKTPLSSRAIMLWMGLPLPRKTQDLPPPTGPTVISAHGVLPLGGFANSCCRICVTVSELVHRGR